MHCSRRALADTNRSGQDLSLKYNGLLWRSEFCRFDRLLLSIDSRNELKLKGRFLCELSGVNVRFFLSHGYMFDTNEPDQCSSK